MKTIKMIMVGAVLTAFFLGAHDRANERYNTLKIRLGAFVPQSSCFKAIYGSAAPDLQVEYARHMCKHLDLWAQLDGYWKKGCSIGLASPTRITVATLSAGVKVPCDISKMVTVYAGAGASLAGVRIYNQSSVFGYQACSKPSLGCVIKSGIDFFFCPCVFLDLFADYVFQPVRFAQRVNVGGGKIGVGLGVVF